MPSRPRRRSTRASTSVRKAADLVGSRSPQAARDGEEESQARHANGQPGAFEPRARLINEWIQAGVIGPAGSLRGRIDRSGRKECHVLANRLRNRRLFNPLKQDKAKRDRGCPNPPQAQAPRPPAGQRMARGGYGFAGSFGNEWTQVRLNKDTAWTLSTISRSRLHSIGICIWGLRKEVPFHSIYHPFNWRGCC